MVTLPAVAFPPSVDVVPSANVKPSPVTATATVPCGGVASGATFTVTNFPLTVT